MAKQVKNIELNKPNQNHQTTSIGKSTNTRPKNKHTKRGFKKNRGQGS